MATTTRSPRPVTVAAERAAWRDRILWRVANQIGNLAEFPAEYDLADIPYEVLQTTLDRALLKACGSRGDARIPASCK